MANRILIFEKDPYLMWALEANITTYAKLIKEESCVDKVTNIEDLEKRLRRQNYGAVVVTTMEGVKATRAKNEKVPLYFLVDGQPNSSGLARQALASRATSCVYMLPLLTVGGGMDRLLEKIFNL